MNRPRALLLDEPLGALDLRLRKQLQIELKRIQQDVGITFVHVTHDQEEAMSMADTIAVMNEGRIEQAGSAADLYERPRTEFVANFLGVSNLVDAKLSSTEGGTASVETHDGARLSLPADRIGPHGDDAVRVGVRPEKITLVPAGQDCPSGTNILRGTVVVAAFLGVSIQYVIRAAGGEELTVIAQNAEGVGAGVTRASAARSSSHGCRSTPSSSPRRPRMPNDPRLERALEEFFTGERLSRRRFIGRAGSTGLALSGLSTVLAACGSIEGTRSRRRPAKPKAATVSHPKTAIGDWTFSNWPLYIDKKVIKNFNKKYGGKCKYVEEINDNFEFYGKIRQQLEQGKPIGRDIITPTDYLAARLVRLGYVEPLDKKNIPNRVNLVNNLQTINYDPDRSYSMPWQSGAIGIGYNIKKTGRELKSVKDLFDPKFKGRVTMLSEPYDSANTVLLGDGVNASDAKIDQILGAIEKIDKANSAGQFRRFTGNDYTTDLAKGNVWVSLAYSGDLIQLQSDNPDLRFAYPEEGAMLFTDNMMMPAKVEHPYAAETMMNYVYEPEVAALICAYVNYISPVEGVKEILAKTDPKLAKNELIFPPEDVAKKLHPYPALSPGDERQMQEAMAQVTGA